MQDDCLKNMIKGVVSYLCIIKENMSKDAFLHLSINSVSSGTCEPSFSAIRIIYTMII